MFTSDQHQDLIQDHLTPMAGFTIIAITRIIITHTGPITGDQHGIPGDFL